MDKMLMIGIAIALLLIIWVKTQRVKRTTAILFYAEWCPACQKIKPEWDNVKNEMSSEINFEEVNVDDKAAVAAKEKVVGEEISSVPTIFVIKGAVISKYEGPPNREKFTDFLKSQ